VDKLWQVLARAAEKPDAPLTCEDCVVVMDTLADLLSDGLPPEEVLAIAEKYLWRCPDCLEYQRALAEFAGLPRQESTKGQPGA
jgi:hypothetical protein